MDYRQILARAIPGRMLSGALNNDKVANAYLFLGPQRSMKRDSAEAFAAALLCDSKNDVPCGKCAACEKIKKGVHPDLIVIKGAGKSIKIEQIRDLISYTRFGPSEGRYKVCIIDDVLSMTPESHNAFLKTLEEPVPGVVFLLLATSDTGIPRTIISRCQKVLFGEEEAALEGEGNIEHRTEMLEFVQEISSAGLDLNKRLSLSARLASDRDSIEGKLDLLAEELWKKKMPSSTRDVSAVIGALSCIKKRANLRLAIDVMCLSLGEN